MPFAMAHVCSEWLAQLEMEKRPECGNAKNGGVMCLMGAGSREAAKTTTDAANAKNDAPAGSE